MNRLPTTKHDDFDHSVRHLQRQAEGALSPAMLARLRAGRLITPDEQQRAGYASDPEQWAERRR